MKKIIIILLLAVNGFLYTQTTNNHGLQTSLTPIEKIESDTLTEEFIEITVTVVGDIMFHSPQITAAYDEETDSYDFSPQFTDVKPIFEAADLSLANFETTTAGPTKQYTGYPQFNSPDVVFDAIKGAGIDVLTTVNNHSLDTGKKGLLRTVKVMREKGIPSVGTYDEESTSRILVKDVKGIKVAILAYTEMTNGLGAQYRKTELDSMLNMMEEDKVLADVAAAKAENADIIIACVHWGDEYFTSPNKKQIEFAEFMAESGVDIIMGSHSHVLQSTDIIEVEDRSTYVIYSMGNFISNQRLETLGANRQMTEVGVIEKLYIRKDLTTNETKLEEVEHIPTWVYRDYEGKSKFTYRILPIHQFKDDENFSEAYRKRMKEGETFANKILLGEE